MKKQLRGFSNVLIASAILALVSCSDDEKGPSLSLEGTVWTETSYSSSGCDDSDDNDSGTSTCNSSECSKLFLYANTFIISEISGGVEYNQTGTYTVSGNNIVATLPGFTFTLTYSISGNTLTITLDDPDSGCQEKITYSGVKEEDPAQYLETNSGSPLEETLWIETSYSRTNCNNSADNESGSSFCTANECYTVQLKGGIITITNTEGGITEVYNGSYTISGDTITVVIFGDTLTITYELDGNTLTITSVDSFDGCTSTTTYIAS